VVSHGWFMQQKKALPDRQRNQTAAVWRLTAGTAIAARERGGARKQRFSPSTQSIEHDSIAIAAAALDSSLSAILIRA